MFLESIKYYSIYIPRLKIDAIMRKKMRSISSSEFPENYR